jgi:hypothetical protein
MWPVDSVNLLAWLATFSTPLSTSAPDREPHPAYPEGVRHSFEQPILSGWDQTCCAWMQLARAHRT